MNLGKLLEEAGVKGGKPVAAPLTLAQAKAMSRSANDTERFPDEAMKRLPDVFSDLKDPKKTKCGNDFLQNLVDVLYRMEDHEFTDHTMIGLCQLAHWHRDRSDQSPSHRKSFSRYVIPLMLQLRDTPTAGRGRKNLKDFVLEKLTTRHG